MANDQPAGAEQLTVAATKAITDAHDIAVSHIDEMIAKLQSVKVTIQARRDEAVSKLGGFIKTVDAGLQGIKALEQNVRTMLESHLGSPTI